MQQKQIDTLIVGAGITGLTLAFHLKRKGTRVHILEQSDRTGGQIRSFREEGFLFESGPNTGVVSYPEVAELFEMLAPDCQLETAREESKQRLIWKKNRFHQLPSGLWSGITTPLFSFSDKLRILGEPFRAKGMNPEESVGELARRRLGRSFLDYAVDPFISGVYAGDPMQLVTRHALPKLYNLEQEHGSFIRGSIAKMKQPKSDRDRLATKKVFSARGGLEQLIHALTKRVGEEQITLSAQSIEILPMEKGWQISYRLHGELYTIHARQVVTTTAAYSLPTLLPFIAREQMMKIANLAYAPVIQVSVGIKEVGDNSYNAFGGLIPSVERQRVLGILFPSACFRERAPESGALFSFFIGGVKQPEWLSRSDEEIEAMVKESLHTLLKFPATQSPDLLRIFRHARAIPQYDAGSGDRFAAIHQIEQSFPGLYLAGNIRNGIGMADRIRQATLLAERI
ncbi:protoporphyrinogen oxidase [Parabacteroides sp. OttesenSCG-928-N08]|nr:protoporphyrinogen oxidase [Parabacteroides sp. OttesenSCG-928-N08]